MSAATDTKGTAMKNYTDEQKVAAVCVLLDRVALLEEAGLSEDEREFVRHAATAELAGKTDEGTRVALATIGLRYAATVDSIVRSAHSAAVGVVRAERWAALKAEGKRPCQRCQATGTYINGGECYGCDGRGYAA